MTSNANKDQIYQIAQKLQVGFTEQQTVPMLRIKVARPFFPKTFNKPCLLETEDCRTFKRRKRLSPTDHNNQHAKMIKQNDKHV